MLFRGNCVILVTGLVPLCSHFLHSRKKFEQDLKPKEAKPSIVSNALFIIWYVICEMQITSATQLDTF